MSDVVHWVESSMFLGEPVDDRVEVNRDICRSIHRSPPAYLDLDTHSQIFETGIKVVDG